MIRFKVLPLFAIFVTCLLQHIYGKAGIECSPCDKRVCLSAMYGLDCGVAGYARDVCGCCYRCAAGKDEMCGGFRNLFGECGFDLYCKPQPIPFQSDQPIPRYGYCVDLKGASMFQTGLIQNKRQMLDHLMKEIQYDETNHMSYGDYLHRESNHNNDKKDKHNGLDFEEMDEDIQMDDGGLSVSGGPDTSQNPASTSAALNDYFDRPEEKWWKRCAPPCTHKFCEDNPREICSAKNILTPLEQCGTNPCSHTSCLSCSYEPDLSVCGTCADFKDEKCMSKYGKCVKTMRRVTRKDPNSYLKQGVVSYECVVPVCSSHGEAV